MTVTHFLFNEIWTEDRAPINRNSFLDLVLQVQKAVSKNERSKLAVHAQ